jgi:hypothetical protein
VRTSDKAWPSEYRVLLACAFGALGIFPITFFYFAPWWWGSWVVFGMALGWCGIGLVINPFRFFEGSPTPLKNTKLARIVQKFPLLCFFLTMFSPPIAWALRIWWFFPWLPWWSLAPYWMARETLIVTVFSLFVSVIASQLSFGRRLLCLIGLLVSNHVVVISTYAAISGWNPDYLGDGETQDCFRMQLWFKLCLGILSFFGLQICTDRMRGKSLGKESV